MIGSVIILYLSYESPQGNVVFLLLFLSLTRLYNLKEEITI